MKKNFTKSLPNNFCTNRYIIQIIDTRLSTGVKISIESTGVKVDEIFTCTSPYLIHTGEIISI